MPVHTFFCFDLNHLKNETEENNMAKINLREYYPFYQYDCIIDVLTRWLIPYWNWTGWNPHIIAICTVTRRITLLTRATVLNAISFPENISRLPPADCPRRKRQPHPDSSSDQRRSRCGCIAFRGRPYLWPGISYSFSGLQAVDSSSAWENTFDDFTHRQSGTICQKVELYRSSG